MRGLAVPRHSHSVGEVGAPVRIALPASLSAGDDRDWRHGRERRGGHSGARWLRDLGLRGATVGAGHLPISLERSVQIGDWVYHLREGQLASHAW